jgi:hypothetical protein
MLSEPLASIKDGVARRVVYRPISLVDFGWVTKVGAGALCWSLFFLLKRVNSDPKGSELDGTNPADNSGEEGKSRKWWKEASTDASNKHFNFGVRSERRNNVNIGPPSLLSPVAVLSRPFYSFLSSHYCARPSTGAQEALFFVRLLHYNGKGDSSISAGQTTEHSAPPVTLFIRFFLSIRRRPTNK